MSELHELGIEESAKGLAKGEFSSVELTQAVIEPCTPVQKGRAITHLVHSTVLQMQAQGDAGTVRKLIAMLQDLPFYSMRLCPDIYANVETLREFLLSCR